MCPIQEQSLIERIEFLQDNMEQGKILIRVNQNLEFRQQLAIAISKDYKNTSKLGWHYFQPTLGRVFFHPGEFMKFRWDNSSVLRISVIQFYYWSGMNVNLRVATPEEIVPAIKDDFFIKVWGQ